MHPSTVVSDPSASQDRLLWGIKFGALVLLLLTAYYVLRFGTAELAATAAIALPVMLPALAVGLLLGYVISARFPANRRLDLAWGAAASALCLAIALIMFWRQGSALVAVPMGLLCFAIGRRAWRQFRTPPVAEP